MSCVFVVGIKVLKDSDIEGRPMLGVGLNDAKAAAHARCNKRNDGKQTIPKASLSGVW